MLRNFRQVFRGVISFILVTDFNSQYPRYIGSDEDYTSGDVPSVVKLRRKIKDLNICKSLMANDILENNILPDVPVIADSDANEIFLKLAQES